MTDSIPPLLPLHNLSKRHHALPAPVAEYLFQAARVCFDRHHVSPKEFTLEDDKVESIARVEWERTDDREKGAWDNDDATEAGACAVAIAAIELTRSLFAIRRMSKGSGADYYLALRSQDLEDLENCFRLEVSGTHSDKSEVTKRLRIKIEQTRRGDSNLPALAAIVGFKVQLILLHTVDESL
ncbi:hypothetical protein RIF25_16545 [Thermosynechococcaceae cyanobacterium BACA0444]|uniref:Uncharacterized protein n=1 Tax=Pseudocalidococcus azoricus BACA0444 TaxID=2918990 RepID=A0AAE4K127_9CYAN|nr:hypothetical protein [Pseudocalidococcus azoricus]MDS3862407.1 hypothetical protein [Pseudocalidococcus azoricus BACA0444]